MIKLSKDTESAIRAEGEKAYPNECCGILLGELEKDNVRRIEELIPIINAREQEEQYHRFRIEPDDFMKAEQKARKQGMEVLGFYHSHPDHPAKPSEYDREYALPFYAYPILEVSNGKALAFHSWELSKDRLKFLEETIAVME
ncbi:M67 family metallopeptidase [Lachnospiraceae bacterium ZAX-1]